MPDRDRQRPGAAGAARRSPAANAREPRQVPAARHLDEHRAHRQRGARRLPGEGREPRGTGGAVAGQLRVLARRDDLRHSFPQDGPRRGERVRPARLEQRGGLRRHRMPAEQRRRALGVSPQAQHLPHVRVRRARLGVQVVAVVPAHHQAEVGDRREHRRPGADDRPDGPAAHREPPPIPLGRAEVGGQRHGGPYPRRRLDRREHPVDVAQVGDDHEGAAARRQRRGDGLADRRRPVGPRDGRPHRPRRPPVRERVQEARPVLVRRPGRARRRRGRGRGCGPRVRAPARPRPGRAAAGRPGAARRRACPRSARPPPGPVRGSPGSEPARARPPCAAGRAGRGAR